MALIKCQECGRDVSDKAQACPHCGCPVKIAKADSETSIPELTPSSIAEESNPHVQVKSHPNIGMMILIFVLAIFALFFIASKFVPSDGNGKKIPGELEAVTYAQLTVKEYYPNAEFEGGTKSYNVVATGLRYKVEGKATINEVSTKFTVIIEFESTEYDEYTIKTVQIGSKKLI